MSNNLYSTYERKLLGEEYDSSTNDCSEQSLPYDFFFSSKKSKKKKNGKKKRKACKKCMAGKKHKTIKACRKCKCNRRNFAQDLVLSCAPRFFDCFQSAIEAYGKINSCKNRAYSERIVEIPSSDYSLKE